MPRTEEHLQRASQNLTFAQSFDLRLTPYIDWVVVAYFYAAIHLVEAILFENGHDGSGNHEERWIHIRTKDYLVGIKDDYRILKGKSRNARYDLTTFTSFKVEQEIIPHYKNIERHILQQLPNASVEPHHWLTRPKAKA